MEIQTTAPTCACAEQIATLNTKITSLRSTIAGHEMNVDAVKDYIGENELVDDEHVTAIAELLGIELTKEYEVEFTISVSATITGPLGASRSDLEEAISWEISSQGYLYDVNAFDGSIDIQSYS
jgi:hypothetical protein